MPRSKQCITLTKAKQVTIRGEHRRAATFTNVELSQFRIIKFDGCLVRNTLAADWIVCKDGFGDLIIEFKGRELGHALSQVAATMETWSNHPERQKGAKLAGLIVCVSQKPSFSAQRQRVERQLRRDFGARLTVFTGNRAYALPELFT